MPLCGSEVYMRAHDRVMPLLRMVLVCKVVSHKFEVLLGKLSCTNQITNMPNPGALWRLAASVKRKSVRERGTHHIATSNNFASHIRAGNSRNPSSECTAIGLRVDACKMDSGVVVKVHF